MLSYISLDSKAIIHNITEIRKRLPKNYKFIAVCKGNAYGHGIKEVAKIVDDYVDAFQVDDVEELLEIREVSTKPVYVLGYISPANLPDAVKKGAIISVFDYERLPIINEIAQNLNIIQPICLKVDCLTGRLGIFPNEVEQYLEELKKYKYIKLEGIYSHLTGIKKTINYEHTKAQLDQFSEVVRFAQENGYKDLTIHISSSGGAFVDDVVNVPYLNAIRIGKAMYGILPTESAGKSIELKPVLKWISHIAQIKTFPANYPLGYYAKYKTSESINAAVIPQGYSDGYDKKNSEKGMVLIHGKRCNIIGTVAMNMLLVDINDLEDAKVNDEVVLIGSQESEYISLTEIGEYSNSSECEVLSKLSAKLPRSII